MIKQFSCFGAIAMEESMKKTVYVFLAASLGMFLNGCLDMDMRDPVIPKRIPCPEGFAHLSDGVTDCPEGKECKVVVDEEDSSRRQMCVEYHPDTSGGGGLNCPAGFVSAPLSFDKCVLADDEEAAKELDVDPGEYACIKGTIANNYCRLVPPDNSTSRVNVLEGQRCGEDEIKPGEDTLRVHIIDVGQGDAIWIQTPTGQNVLVDGGDGGAFGKTAAGPIVTDYLNSHGFAYGSTFDAVFLTHPHADHFGGFNNIFNTNNSTSYRIKNYIDPMDLDSPPDNVPSSYKQWQDRVKKLITDRSHIYMPAKDKFSKGAMMPEEFFGPEVKAQYITSRDTYSGDDANIVSIVFKLTYGNYSFMFTGDAEADQEADAIRAVDDLSSQYLKVCHHGSSTSSTPRFLDAVWPDSIPKEDRFALISSGRQKYSNSYIPTVETLDRLYTYIPMENLFSTSAGDDDKNEEDASRDDNILIVIKPNGEKKTCYSGTN